MKGSTTIKFESFQRIYFESSAGLSTPVLRHSLHASIAEDPFFEIETKFSDLLDLAIKGNTVFNGTVRPEDKKYLLDGFEALLDVIKEKRKHVESLPAFNEEKKVKFKP